MAFDSFATPPARGRGERCYPLFAAAGGRAPALPVRPPSLALPYLNLLFRLDRKASG